MPKNDLRNASPEDLLIVVISDLENKTRANKIAYLEFILQKEETIINEDQGSDNDEYRFYASQSLEPQRIELKNLQKHHNIVLNSTFIERIQAFQVRLDEIEKILDTHSHNSSTSYILPYVLEDNLKNERKEIFSFFNYDYFIKSLDPQTQEIILKVEQIKSSVPQNEDQRIQKILKTQKAHAEKLALEQSEKQARIDKKIADEKDAADKKAAEEKAAAEERANLAAINEQFEDPTGEKRKIKQEKAARYKAELEKAQFSKEREARDFVEVNQLLTAYIQCLPKNNLHHHWYIKYLTDLSVEHWNSIPPLKTLTGAEFFNYYLESFITQYESYHAVNNRTFQGPGSDGFAISLLMVLACNPLKLSGSDLYDIFKKFKSISHYPYPFIQMAIWTGRIDCLDALGVMVEAPNKELCWPYDSKKDLEELIEFGHSAAFIHMVEKYPNVRKKFNNSLEEFLYSANYFKQEEIVSYCKAAQENLLKEKAAQEKAKKESFNRKQANKVNTDKQRAKREIINKVRNEHHQLIIKQARISVDNNLSELLSLVLADIEQTIRVNRIEFLKYKLSALKDFDAQRLDEANISLESDRNELLQLERSSKDFSTQPISQRIEFLSKRLLEIEEISDDNHNWAWGGISLDVRDWLIHEHIEISNFFDFACFKNLKDTDNGISLHLAPEQTSYASAIVSKVKKCSNITWQDLSDIKRLLTASTAQTQLPQNQLNTADESATQKQAPQGRSTNESAVRERAAQEKAAQERATQERASRERATQERAAQERATQERAAQERAVQERATQERDARERDAQERTTQKKNVGKKSVTFGKDEIINDQQPSQSSAPNKPTPSYNIYLRMLSGIALVAGAVALIVAFAALNAATMGTAGLALAITGGVAVLAGGTGLFATRNKSDPGDLPPNLDPSPMK